MFRPVISCMRPCIRVYWFWRFVQCWRKSSIRTSFREGEDSPVTDKAGGLELPALLGGISVIDLSATVASFRVVIDYGSPAAFVDDGCDRVVCRASSRLSPIRGLPAVDHPVTWMRTGHISQRPNQPFPTRARTDAGHRFALALTGIAPRTAMLWVPRLTSGRSVVLAFGSR